jgi:signal peptidase I
MKNYKDYFEKFYGKYLDKRSFFRNALEEKKAAGADDFYKRGTQLLKEAETISQEIKQTFSKEEIDGLDSVGNPAVLKGKIKDFVKNYKGLCDLSKSMIRQWFEAVIVALLLVFVLRSFVFSIYHVPTGSAEPNILIGDRLWGNKMAYMFSNVKPGDLVIFDDPREGYDESSYVQYLWQRYIGIQIPLLGLKAGPINVVKRVVAIPGDVVEGKIENGKTAVYLNGEKLDLPTVNKLPLIVVRKTLGFFDFENFGPFRIPGFLQSKEKLARYTYDPSVSFDDQPYYNIKEDEVVKNPVTGKPEMLLPLTPSPSYGISIDNFGPLTVPKDSYWCMGDNRKNSADSREWGFLENKFVHGRASFIIWSLDSEEAFWLFDFIKHPVDFATKHLRWNRFFKKLL